MADKSNTPSGEAGGESNLLDAPTGGQSAGWTKRTAASVADETARLGKETVRSDLVKDAAAGAAIGAVVAVPLPVIGPIGGAVIGAAFGVFRNFMRKGSSATSSSDSSNAATNMYSDLLKLGELREKGILTEAEFDAEKRKLLARNP